MTAFLDVQCQRFRPKQHSEPLISHTISTLPFEKIRVDLFYMNNKTYFLVVEMCNSLSKATISYLKDIFCWFGIPKVVVSNNGPQFACSQYNQSAEEFGIEVIFANPQHAQSNGQVELFVQSIKNVMKKLLAQVLVWVSLIIETPIDGGGNVSGPNSLTNMVKRQDRVI